MRTLVSFRIDRLRDEKQAETALNRVMFLLLRSAREVTGFGFWSLILGFHFLNEHF